MVNTILKYIGSSVKASLTFLDNCYSPAFRIDHTGEVYFGDGVSKENVSISDNVGNCAYIRLLQPETARETKRISSCSKKFNYSAKCRLVYYSFTDDAKEWPIDKRKQAIKNVLNNLTFLGFKDMSSEISISINTVDDNFQKVFKAETNQEFSGDNWPFIIAIDFTINYSTSTDSECQDLCVNTDFEIIEPTPETSKTFCEKVENCTVITELQSTVIDLQEQIDNLPTSGLTCETLSDCTEIQNLQSHVLNTSNPHNVTKSQVGLSNVDNTSDLNKPISTAQQSALDLKEDKANKATNFNTLNNDLYPTTQATKDLVDYYIQSNIKIIGDWDATSGAYPKNDESNTTPFIAQWGATIKAGWAFRVGYGQAGTVAGFDYENGDVVYALIDNPSYSNSAHWGDLDHNLQQANESVRGTAKVITTTIAADETTTDDERYVTGKKLWLNFWTRVLAIAHTFAAKITFTTAPRFSSVTASHVLTVDSNKDLTSESKGTAFNKNFGTGTSNVPEIGASLGNNQNVRTNSSGKLISVNDPTWTDISSTSTITGWSSFTVKEIFELIEGNKVTIFFYLSGTSDSATTKFTVTNNANNGIDIFYGFTQSVNNGVTATSAPARASITGGTNEVVFSTNWGGTNYTGSGTKSVRGTIVYYK